MGASRIQHGANVKARLVVLTTLTISLLACGGAMRKASEAVGLTDGGTTQTREGFDKVVDDGTTTVPGTREATDCGAPIDTPRAKGCTIGKLSCGDVIEANNQEQTNQFDDDFVVGKYCAPQRNDYGDGPDARWMLEIPENTQADITLTSECVDLDLFSVRWASATKCPTAGVSTGECEGSTKTGEDHVRITSVSRAENHLVWVDGKSGVTGNFRLEIKCKNYR